MRRNKNIIIILTLVTILFWGGFASVQASQYTMSWNFRTFNNPNARQVATNMAEKQEGNLLNPGFRLENQLTGTPGRALKLVSEAYYLREEDDFAGFISLAFEPHPLGYFGAGAEVTGRANYQVFAGINVTENIFAEVKGINSEENGSEETEIYFGTGFMIGF